ncbi:HAD family hydrolase, partial [Massilia alkalitolerans]|uniref:HAD family hydrolase n=1 Tax=Massilia alkalitolerans TaxID=286638 RepID=UPI0028AD6664
SFRHYFMTPFHTENLTGSIYQHICDELGCQPQQVLMVGDSIVADVEGPRLFGMKSMLLNRNAAGRTKAVLTSLEDVLDLV